MGDNLPGPAPEDQLQSEALLRTLVRVSPDAIVTMNQAGLITGWNPAAESIFGWSREEAIGRLLSDTIVPERYRIAHEAGLARYLFSGDGPVLGKVLDHLAGLHRDGSEFRISLSIAPAWQHGVEVTFIAFVRRLADPTT